MMPLPIGSNMPNCICSEKIKFTVQYVVGKPHENILFVIEQ